MAGEDFELAFLVQIIEEGPQGRIVRIRKHLVKIYIQDGYETDINDREEQHNVGVIIHSYPELIYRGRCRCNRCRRSHQA